MTTLELVNEKVRELPQEKQQEVLDFVEFLRAKAEDEEDLAAARAALEESDERIPYDKVREELGLTDE